MVDLMRCLTNWLFFDILLLYCYTNLNSWIICCLSWRYVSYFLGDMYLIFLILTLIYTYVLGTNLNSSIICCLSFVDMYLSFLEGSSFCIYFCFVICSFLVNFFETLVILSAILLPIKSPVASAVFWIALFEAVLLHVWKIY